MCGGDLSAVSPIGVGSSLSACSPVHTQITHRHTHTHTHTRKYTRNHLSVISSMGVGSCLSACSSAPLKPSASVYTRQLSNCVAIVCECVCVIIVCVAVAECVQVVRAEYMR